MTQVRVLEIASVLASFTLVQMLGVATTLAHLRRLLLIEILLVVYPKVTSVPFNDAYRYMDWLLTGRRLSAVNAVYPSLRRR